MRSDHDYGQPRGEPPPERKRWGRSYANPFGDLPARCRGLGGADAASERDIGSMADDQPARSLAEHFSIRPVTRGDRSVVQALAYAAGTKLCDARDRRELRLPAQRGGSGRRALWVGRGPRSVQRRTRSRRDAAQRPDGQDLRHRPALAADRPPAPGSRPGLLRVAARGVRRRLRRLPSTPRPVARSGERRPKGTAMAIPATTTST